MTGSGGLDNTIDGGVSHEDILSYMQADAEADRQVASAVGVRRAGKRRAKDSGIPTDVVAEAARYVKLGRELAVARLQALVRILWLRGTVGEDQLSSLGQFDVELSSAAVTRQSRLQAEDAGWAAGFRRGLAADDNLYPSGSDEHATWERWRARGALARAQGSEPETEQVTADRRQPDGRDLAEEPVVIVPKKKHTARKSAKAPRVAAKKKAVSRRPGTRRKRLSQLGNGSWLGP